MENKKRTDLEECIVNYKGNYYLKTEVGYKKIILTTDPDLIADGVQAIDDEFLEWFVNNPSCEFVETKISIYKHYYKTGEIMTSLSPTPDFSSRNMQCEKAQPIYKIIIPQEEPKQETLTYTEAAKKEERIFNSTMMSKQETLEEAADNWVRKPLIGTRRDSFMAGAKWQAEQDKNKYNDEDMIAFMQFIISNPVLSNTSSVSETTARYYLEQFKKK